MKTLEDKFKKIDSYSGVEYAQRMIELYKEFPNEERQIDEYIKNRVYAVAASADKVIDKAVKYQLSQVKDVLSLSYIAKNYFNKSRQWLNHRINGSIVNGKPARFTDEQLATFNLALKDISNKISTVNIV